MMNILEQEDIIKGLPDQALMQEAQMPSGQVPQFLVISEIQRRKDMRKRYNSERPQEGTVKDQILGEAGMGIMGAMPPQMAMPQQAPQQSMPPVKRMQAGGITSTSMPGSGALYAAQKEYVDPLLERAKVMAQVAGISVDEALEQLKISAQMNMPNYSMLGRNDLMASASEMGQRLSDLGGRGADAMRDAYAAIPQYSTDDPLQGAKDFAGNFAFESAMNMPNYQMLAPAGNDLSMPSIDLGMPTRDQRIAADRARVEGIRGALSDSVTSQDVDDAVAGMVTERAPRSGGFGGIADALGNMFDFGLSERYAERYPEAVAANERTKSNIADFFDRSPQMERYQSMLDLRQNPGMLDYETNIESKLMADYIAARGGGDYPSTASDTLADTFGISRGDANVQGESPIQTQADGSKRPALEPDLAPAKTDDDASGILGALTETPSGDRSNPVNRPTLDFDDLIAESRRQGLSNALMQLGAGIAGGDVAAGISAAGKAATEGTQAARELDMRRRLTEFEAGREDLRRESEEERFAEKMGFDRERLKFDERKFNSELDLLKKRVENAATSGNASVIAALVSSTSRQIEEILKLGKLMSDDQKIRLSTLTTQLDALRAQYLPTDTTGFSINKPGG